MRIEVVTTSRRLTISGRRWTTETIQAHLQIAWNLPDDLDWQISLLKPHNCRFIIDLIRYNIAVNRDNHVVSTSTVSPIKQERRSNPKSHRASAAAAISSIIEHSYYTRTRVHPK